MASACLSENDVQALIGGALGAASVERAEVHLDRCLKCQLLVSAGVRTTSLRAHGLPDQPAAHALLAAGEVISGRYEITRFIARGGMGEVYAAHDRMLGEEIAIKFLHGRTSGGAEAIARLKAEVQLARRVTDPHVLRVFDLGSYLSPDGDETLYLTMQLLAGETLRARIRREGPLPPAEVWRLAADMFTALGAAHQIGIVHRDFKSDNVMLVPTPEGRARAVVMDFGLAQRVAIDGPSKDDDQTPLVAGTLGYMAPEQLSGGEVSAAADVYAFGVVLHEMLTAVLPPFRPDVGRRGAATPPPPRLLDALDIPAPWASLIRRCLARDPRARYQTIIEARDAIARRGHARRRLAFAGAALAAVATVAIAVSVASSRSAAEGVPAPTGPALAREIAATVQRDTTETAKGPSGLEPQASDAGPKAAPSSTRRRPRTARAVPQAVSVLDGAGDRNTDDRPARPASPPSDGDEAIDPFRDPRKPKERPAAVGERSPILP